LKQQGCKVITNDFLNFNNQIGKALIENKSVKLEKKDLDILFQHIIFKRIPRYITKF
jgi:adenine-specific DNA methylase